MVFYFSGTGNSKNVAEKIAKKTKEKLLNIVECLDDGEVELKFSKTERIGIVFPVYYGGIPLIINDFIELLETVNILNGELNNRYLYIVYTYEMYAAGVEFQIAKLLKNKKLEINYINSIKMPNNFSVYYDLPNIEKETNTLKLADLEVEKIIKEIKEKQQKKYSKNIVKRLITKVMYPVYKYGRKTRRFYADDKCINCKLCEEICPAKAIKIKNKKPVWIKKQCQYCLACYNLCPVNSIQIGKWTRNRRRYNNPNTKTNNYN